MCKGDYEIERGIQYGGGGTNKVPLNYRGDAAAFYRVTLYYSGERENPLEGQRAPGHYITAVCRSFPLSNYAFGAARESGWSAHTKRLDPFATTLSILHAVPFLFVYAGHDKFTVLFLFRCSGDGA